MDHGAGDRHPLPLPSRELIGAVAAPRREADRRQRFGGTLAPLSGRPAVEQEGVLDVLQRAEHRHEVEGLEDEAEPPAAQEGALPLAERREVGAVHEDLPRVGLVEAAEEVEQRALAAPRRSGHRDQLAAADREVDAAQRRHPRLSQPVPAFEPRGREGGG